MAYYAGAPGALPIENLFGEQAPPSRYVLTSVYRLSRFWRGGASENRTRSSTLLTYYLPLSATAKAGQPIRVVLKVYGKLRYAAKERGRAPPDHFSGMLFERLDNFTRLRFEQRGLPLAEHHWVLDDSAAPGWYRDFGEDLLLWVAGRLRRGVAVDRGFSALAGDEVDCLKNTWRLVLG